MILLTWLVGVLTGIGGVLLYQKIRLGTLIFKEYHWIILVIWYLAGLFVIGFIGTSLAEGEPQAAGMATLIFGGIYLVLSILLYRLAFYDSIATLRKAQSDEQL